MPPMKMPDTIGNKTIANQINRGTIINRKKTNKHPSTSFSIYPPKSYRVVYVDIDSTYQPFTMDSYNEHFVNRINYMLSLFCSAISSATSL